jgi:hypothetical protein
MSEQPKNDKPDVAALIHDCVKLGRLDAVEFNALLWGIRRALRVVEVRKRDFDANVVLSWACMSCKEATKPDPLHVGCVVAFKAARDVSAMPLETEEPDTYEMPANEGLKVT